MAAVNEQTVKKRPPPHVDIGVAAFSLPGHLESGDAWLVKSHPHGLLMAVVDGCGHGAEAAVAARAAREVLAGHPTEGVIALVNRCHKRLRDTRGVVMSLASIRVEDRTMTWIGVGNVEGMLIRAAAYSPEKRNSLFLRGGVVGYRLPPLEAAVLPIENGDVLLFATDGIRPVFPETLSPGDAPQRIAESICERNRKGTDEGLVLVVRYLG